MVELRRDDLLLQESPQVHKGEETILTAGNSLSIEEIMTGHSLSWTTHKRGDVVLRLREKDTTFSL